MTAAVVGVIANLALWFALHVLFARVTLVEAGLLRLQVPEITTFDWRTGAIALIAAVTIFAFKWSIVRTLLIAAGCGLLLASVT